MSTRNWSGSHHYPVAPVSPSSEDELASLVAEAAAAGKTVGIVGSRHSFTDVPDGHVMVHLGALPERFEVAADGRSVSVNGAMTYARFAELAQPHGLALANTASLPQVTIAGATATATHGSGSGNRSLASAITAMTLLGGDGTHRRIIEAEELAGTAINIGFAGCCTEIELAVEPAYEVSQRVFEALPFNGFIDNFDAVMDCAYSVSAFTDWTTQIDQVWVKHRVDQPDRSNVVTDLGATPATVQRHPIASLSGEDCTDQTGAPGLWAARLPHFRADAMPNAGDEVQTEYFVARADGAAAVAALIAVGADLAKNLLASEVRTIAADDLWMSPFRNRDSVAFHFTWGPGTAAAERSAAMVADALAPFDPLPHWGKVFTPDPTIIERYPMADRFLADVVDPVFANPWLDRHLARP